MSATKRLYFTLQRKISENIDKSIIQKDLSANPVLIDINKMIFGNAETDLQKIVLNKGVYSVFAKLGCDTSIANSSTSTLKLKNQSNTTLTSLSFNNKPAEVGPNQLIITQNSVISVVASGSSHLGVHIYEYLKILP